MYCRKCGKEIEGESLYCKECEEQEKNNKTKDTKNTKNVKRIFISVTVIVVMIGISLGAFYISKNPVKKFMESIEVENSTEAINIYKEHIAGNDSREVKINEKLEQYIEEKRELFKNQKISFDEVLSKLLAVDKTEVIDEKVHEVIDEVKHIHECREIFKAAEEASAKGDYDTAISLYSEVVGEKFENGDVAIERLAEVTTLYRNEILEETKSLIAKTEFETAIAKFDESLRILPNDVELELAKENCLKSEYDYTIQGILNEIDGILETKEHAKAIYYLTTYINKYPEENKLQDLMKKCLEQYKTYVLEETQKLVKNRGFKEALMLFDKALEVLKDQDLLKAREDCVQEQYNYEIQTLIDEANVFIKNNNYVDCLKYLNEQIKNYPNEIRLEQELQKNTTLFEEYVINETLKKAHEGDFEYAISLAKTGLKYFSSSNVSELLKIYVSHVPVRLGDMEKFQNNTNGGSGNGKTDKSNRHLTDNYGNEYEHSFSAGCGSIVYLVNYQYQKLSGTVAFPKGVDADGFRSSATLKIYGDDKEIAKFVNVSEDTKPSEISLDISGYEKVKLQWTCEGLNIWQDWGYFATIFEGTFIPIPLEIPKLEQD